MRRGISTVAAVVLAAILLGAPGAALAEVSSSRERNRARTTIFSDSLQSIADDPDPIPSVRWQPLSLTPLRRPLNPAGDSRPDGPPFVAFHPDSGWPVVVWAYNNGTDHDVAYARWTGSEWTPATFVTASLDDERDPEAVVAEDGTVHVVWWVDGNDPKVMTTSIGPSDSSFATATRVSATVEHAARPSAAIAGGALWIAYELALPDTEPAAGGSPPIASRVVVERRLESGEFERARAIDSTRSTPLDVEIHSHGGRLWIDWKLDDTQFGYVEASNGDGWSATRAVPWADPSWIGQEDVRQTVRQLVLWPGVATTVDATE